MTDTKPSRSAVPFGWKITLGLVKRVPQGVLSRALGRLADMRLPGPVQGKLNRAFARAVGVNLAEVEEPPEAFPSLSAFFVRRLRPGARSWPHDPTLPASPVDGIVGAVGTIESGRLIQAKGLDYTVGDLLEDAGEAKHFHSGTFVTIYLSPRHYHRIHAPVTARLHAAASVPGKLFPVNEPAVRSIPRLFPRNERLIAFMEGERGRLALAAIGAYNVGRISAAFDPEWGGGVGSSVTNRPGRSELERRHYSPALAVRQGEELMAFHLGSTIVLLLEASVTRSLTQSSVLRAGNSIKLGDSLFQ